MASGEEEATTFLSRAASSLPPPHAIRDLLFHGVCVRCIFRLFGVSEYDDSCPLLKASTLLSLLKERRNIPNAISENGSIANGLTQCPYDPHASGNEQPYCSVCLGILQFTNGHDQDLRTCEGNSVSVLTSAITEILKKEAHQIDGFSIEISLPPVVSANDRAVWLYMKRRYASEEWFIGKLLSQQISVKDALRSLVTTSLESCLGVKSSSSSFCIRLTYIHEEASSKLQCSMQKFHGFKIRKTETYCKEHMVDDLCGKNETISGEFHRCDSDAVVHCTLNAMQDDAFSELFMLPPEKTNNGCKLTISCYRLTVYIGGRYLKFSRRVSQSRWMIEDERMGEASVEEIIGSNTILVCGGDSYKFHAAGREDIDVRMLGSGRPFLVEVSNARVMPSMANIQEIADKINNSNDKYVAVRNLKLVGSEAWNLLREGEAEKQKQYAAVVWISRPVTEEDFNKISSIKNLDVLQKTPVRVLHRRSPMDRKKIIHWMMVDKIVGTSQYFLLHLCTQAGTYIKEFVHGDLGRTHPSLGSILGCRAEILQLDVTDVKMDCFD
ncbi:tRNA pseudouridine synthase Pus10 isoform X1 [Dioscorea cayenensis subsp. rotundata]|uniref:tRNA pseudouridine(55) synthase n=1 Tax=Dioscorea cayennensis subsp. rotundata TaxID=55577 RepID=A0AB40CEC4_DIOCR|nr:tRNA pseudouridine synthase Pus10 isoform X1 [Dioscorea cayenensis subsp. rotundata]